MKPFEGMDINALCRHSDETDTCGQVKQLIPQRPH